MNQLHRAQWIKAGEDFGTVCPVFKKKFNTEKPIKKAVLHITALGVYEAYLNGQRLGDFIMAPGWTSYDKRLQVQEYDVTDLIGNDNELTVTVGNGWCVGRLVWEKTCHFWHDHVGLIAMVMVTYTDGTTKYIKTDESWQVAKSPVLFSEIYDGEIFDSRIVPNGFKNVVLFEHPKDILIDQEGEFVREIEEISPIDLIITPKGEKVIDFGQNMTGYVRCTIKGKAGDRVVLSHAEILDKNGNFYTDNLRTAKQRMEYICNGMQTDYKPHFTFQGFRYIRIDEWPWEDIDIHNFKAIVVHSDIRRTGYFECSSPMLNQLYQNVIWGQKGNFLDVPTDCPQRDERLGWTGDAQVFVKTASYNFDVEKFFTKWLRDLKADQFEDGGVPHVVPKVLGKDGNSAAWGDAAVICPWQIYLTYGNQDILAQQYDSMQKWVEYIRRQGENEFLWNTGGHFGDWLAMDGVNEDWKGGTDLYLIATAFYAYSTSLLIKASRVLKKDVTDYESLYKNIVLNFKNEYIKDGKLISDTQTAHALALYFDLTDNKEQLAQNLCNLVKENANKLTTGFVGTPYLLYALSDNGHEELAYTLILQEEYPSWLFSVRMGATTIWEHWDGMRPDGSMWSDKMNSFNHYAYGAVAGWMYEVMAGIHIDENAPAFKHIIFKPVTDQRIDFVCASIETKYGTVSSEWERKNGTVQYTFNVPEDCTATIMLEACTYEVGAGIHSY